METLNFILVIYGAVETALLIASLMYLWKQTKKQQNTKKQFSTNICRQQLEIDRLTTLLSQANETIEHLDDNYDYIRSSREKIDEYLEQERAKRQEEIDSKLKDYHDAKINSIEAVYSLKEQEYNKVVESIKEEKSAYDAMINQLRQLSLDKLEHLKGTIQLSQEDKDDINYLYSISSRFHHPDILYKLIWSDYIQKPFTQVLKDNNINEVAGIYKITNIESGKAYIGRSVNVKKRLQDHVKSAVGISTIADQAIHHAIKEKGFENWRFELLEEASKERLPEREKYYIDLFNTQQYGYNINSGG